MSRRPKATATRRFMYGLLTAAGVVAGLFAQGRAVPTQDTPRAPIDRTPVVPKPFVLTPLAQPAPTPYQPMSAARAEAFVDAATRKLDYIPGEVLVKFKSGVTVAGQQRALSAVRSQPSVSGLHWIDQVALLHDDTQPDSNVLAAQLSSQPEVEFAEPNRRKHRGAITPNDPGYATKQWNLPLIQMPDAWALSPGADSSIIVAVVDTGVTSVASQTFTFLTWNGASIQSVNLLFKGNPDLNVSRLVSPHDYVTNMGNVVLDTDGHGTHVSSTIGEDTNNSIGEAGIAYNARIMPVKVCASFWDVQFGWSAAGHAGLVPTDSGGCPDDAIASGIRYAADNGARVINLSLGGEGTSTTVQNALQYAISKGAFIAMAAGNEHDEGNPTEYPAAYGPSMDGAMAVGAIGPTSLRAYYSNTGSYIEIVAPGGDNRVSAPTGYVWQSTLYPPFSDITVMSGTLIPRFDTFAEVGYEGTSMATPHVAGVAALLMSHGIKTPADVENVIKNTAKHLGTSAGRDDSFGFGLIQARAALFGFGVVKK